MTDVESQLQRIKTLDQGRPRKNITILGAGTAGLAAAYELEKLGHTVRIFEGSHRAQLCLLAVSLLLLLYYL